MADINNVKAVFRITPARLKALFQAFPDDLLRREPAPGEWSPIQVLHHLISADRLFTARTRAALVGDDQPAMSSASEVPDVSALELVAQFEALRNETLALLEQVNEEHFEIEIMHPRMGLMTLHNMLNYWGGHDLMHLIQIEQAVMQPFIPVSGPWQVNFAKHILNPDETQS
jgi:uncharacterized damage-inducible protein DinB